MDQLHSSLLFTLIQFSNLKEIQNMFQRAELDLLSLRDPKGQSVLHACTLAESIPLAEFLIEQIRAKNSEEELKAFVNAQNSEGFTCIMTAIQIGNKVTHT